MVISQFNYVTSTQTDSIYDYVVLETSFNESFAVVVAFGTSKMRYSALIPYERI